MKIIIALLIPAALIGLTRLFRGKSTADPTTFKFWLIYLALAAGFYAVMVASWSGVASGASMDACATSSPVAMSRPPR